MTMQVRTVGAKPNRQITGDLPTTTTALTLGTAMGLAAARNLAHGIGSDYGLTTIKVSGACLVTLYVFDEVDRTWGTGGANSGRYQLDFDARGQDEFSIPPDQLFYLVSDTGSITCTTSARRVRDRYPID